jgi:hypothetical protein
MECNPTSATRFSPPGMVACRALLRTVWFLKNQVKAGFEERRNS